MSDFIDKLLPAPVNGGFKMDGYWVWCGSPIKGEDGKYHLFSSRWPDCYPMHPGWLFHSEIVRATAEAPEGPYEFQEVVLGRREEHYFDGKAVHNPAIRKFGDTYYLFYTGATYCFPPPEAGENHPQHGDLLYSEVWCNKRVGIATSKSLLGPWKRPDAPIVQVRSGKWDSAIISNPAPWIMPDGKTYVLYKSCERKCAEHAKPGRYAHMPFKLGMLYADQPEGPYTRLSEDPVFPAPGQQGDVEDPFMWHDGEQFNIIMKDMDGTLCGEKHAGIHVTSKDPANWDLSNCTLAYSRNLLWDDGQVRKMGNMERPALLMNEDGMPTHLFAATADGTGGFQADHTWNAVVPMKLD